MEEPRVKVGIGVTIFKNGKVLLGRRKVKGHDENVYASPGGHLEFGESFEDCVRREVMEETGMEVDNIRLVTFANLLHWPGKHYVDVGFDADWKAGEPQLLEPDKCDHWGWYDIDNLPQPLMMGDQLRGKARKESRLYYGTIR